MKSWMILAIMGLFFSGLAMSAETESECIMMREENHRISSKKLKEVQPTKQTKSSNTVGQ